MQREKEKKELAVIIQFYLYSSNQAFLNMCNLTGDHKEQETIKAQMLQKFAVN